MMLIVLVFECVELLQLASNTNAADADDSLLTSILIKIKN